MKLGAQARVPRAGPSRAAPCALLQSIIGALPVPHRHGVSGLVGGVRESRGR